MMKRDFKVEKYKNEEELETCFAWEKYVSDLERAKEYNECALSSYTHFVTFPGILG